MNQTKFPPGWDEARVRRVLQHYENQTEEEAVAEDEAAWEKPDHTVMDIPNELVPAVRDLLAQGGEGDALRRDIIREHAEGLGMKTVALFSIDETWSSLRLKIG